jgi:hypothetical protein
MDLLATMLSIDRSTTLSKTQKKEQKEQAKIDYNREVMKMNPTQRFEYSEGLRKALNVSEAELIKKVGEAKDRRTQKLSSPSKPYDSCSARLKNWDTSKLSISVVNVFGTRIDLGTHKVVLPYSQLSNLYSDIDKNWFMKRYDKTPFKHAQKPLIVSNHSYAQLLKAEGPMEVRVLLE